MQQINKLSLGKKLGLLLLLPLSFMAYFIFVEIRIDLRTVDEAREIAAVPQYLEAMSDVIHELQKERGNSAGFINTQGKKFGPELSNQRKLVDTAIENLRQVHASLEAIASPGMLRAMDAILAKKAEIPAMRERVSALTLTTPKALAFYSGVIGTVLDQVGYMPKLASSGQIAAKISGYSFVLNMKEAAGIERAMIAGIYANQKMSNTQFERMLTLIASQDAYARLFVAGAQGEQKAVFDTALASEGYSQALAIRKKIVDFGHGDIGVEALNLDPVAVFGVQTQKLDALKEVEKLLATDMATYAETKEATAWNYVTVAVVEGGLALLLTIFLATMLVRSILGKVKLAVDAAQRVGDGNLTVAIKANGEDEIADLLGNLSTTQDRLVGVISDIQLASQDLDSGVNEIAAGNQNLSERTQQQASSLEEITKKMQTLSEAVSSSTRQQVEGDQLAKQALELTTGCSDMVRQLYLSMQEIRESSKNIMTITSVIDEIAFQTNLLSLNAAVEAARAGEQGKGFAVVAAEVRQLAQRSSSAASEINDLIDNGVEKVNKGGDLAETARNALNNVQESVRSVSEVMRDLSSNSQTQADDIGEISGMVAEIDGVTQRNAALVEEVAAASETLGQNSAELSKVTKYFQLKG